MTYYSDNSRHLVCFPFSVENLHEMARVLSINRCWFHASPRFPHYDIPKKRLSEIAAKTTVVSSRMILKICKGEIP